MVDERMEITSVLDWEWSRVGPVQYFQPPLWLTGHDTEFLALGYIDCFSTRHINRVWFRGIKDVPKRIETFIREDLTRRDLVERLCRALETYKEELQQLDGTSDPGDSATTPDPFPRRPFFGT